MLNTTDTTAIDNASFEKFVTEFLRGHEMSQKAANKAIHAAVRDALFRKSVERANILWNAAKDTVHAKTIKRGLYDFAGGFFTDAFGTFRRTELAAIQHSKKAGAWELVASAEELNVAVNKYRSVENISYTAMKFDSVKADGLTVETVKEQVEKWIAKPDKWAAPDAAELARLFSELLPVLGMETPLNVANRVQK